MGLIVAYGQFLPGGKEDALSTIREAREAAGLLPPPPTESPWGMACLPSRAFTGCWACSGRKGSGQVKGSILLMGLAPVLSAKGWGGIAHLTANAQELPQCSPSPVGRDRRHCPSRPLPQCHHGPRERRTWVEQALVGYLRHSLWGPSYQSAHLT